MIKNTELVGQSAVKSLCARFARTRKLLNAYTAKREKVFHFSDEELLTLLNDDVPYLDNTSFGLNISGEASLEFFPKKDEIVLCGVDECKKIAQILGIECKFSALNSSKIQPKEVFLSLQGEALSLLRVVKTLQNILEYASSVATYTNEMLTIARKFNPKIALLGTRKTLPFAKKLLLKALISGGGVPHRYGLSDSILLFKEHRLLCDDLEKDFARLKTTFKEHKIIVEVENADEAEYFANLQADILQCERFKSEDLRALVSKMRAKFPHILLSATGDINKENVAEFAKTGVDMIVSTAMYRAKVLDIKALFSRL